MELTSSQAAALAFARNTVVSAGAGSGKTRVLVELFLKLLAERAAEGEPAPDRIVAITFTEKAAGEMRERIRAAVDARIAAATEAADTAGAAWWSEARRKLPSAPIRTIHSFCAGLLRENAAEAGVDPKFVVLDERQAGALFESALWEVVVGGVQRGDARVQELVEDFGLQRGADFAPDGVLDFLRRLHGEIAGSGTDVREVALAGERRDAGVDATTLRALAERLTAAVQAFVGAAGHANKAGEAAAGRLRFAWERLASDLPRLGSDAPAAVLRRFRSLVEAVSYRGNTATAVRDHVRAIKDLVGDDGELLMLFAEIKGRAKGALVLDVLRDVDAAYRTRKQQRAGLDFEDLQTRTRALLRDWPAVRRRYKTGFDFLLVDEFQDTNDLQREIVTWLAEAGGHEAELPPGGCYRDAIHLAERKLFIVGDAKQSIYGFRGADVGVFRGLAEQIEAAGGTPVAFQDNFRSVPWIVYWINELAEGQLLAPAGEPAPDVSYRIRFGPRHRLIARRPAAEWDGQVEVIAVPGEGAVEVRAAEAAVLAERVLDLTDPERGARVGDGMDRRPVKFGDIAFLFRVLTDVKLYEHELRRRNIPFYVVHGRGFFETQEVKDLLNLVAWLDNPLEQVALAGFLRSPMVGLSDAALFHLADAGGAAPGRLDLGRTDALAGADAERLARARAWIAEWARLRDRLPVAELLDRVAAQTGYGAVLLTLFQGEQRVANVRKLIELARDFEGRGAALFRDFVRYLAGEVEAAQREPEFPLAAETADVVHLMSVHQAKGLEFPVVFVPDLARRRPPQPGSVAFSPRRGLAACVPTGPLGSTVRSRSARELLDEAKDREDEESRRLFYVAVTRARDRLILSGALTRAAQGTWAHHVKSFVGEAALAQLEGGTGSLELPFAVRDRGDGQPGEGRVRLAAGRAGAARGRRLEPTLSALWGDSPPAPAPADLERARRLLSRVGAPAAPSVAGASRGVVRASALGLADLALCARRHFYRQRLELDDEDWAEAAAAAAGPASPITPGARERGLLAHRVLERLDLRAPARAVEREVAERLAGLAGRVVAGDAGLERVRDDVVAFLKGRWAEQLREARTVEREVPFSLALRLSGGGTLAVEGVIDVLFERADGEWCVLDYKAGRRHEERLEAQRFQILAYALAAQRAVGAERVNAAIAFLGDRGSAPVVVPSGARELARFEERLVALGEALAARGPAEADWPQVQPPARCAELGCGFRPRCGR